MKTYLTKTISGLIPNDPESEEWFRKIKVGSVVSAEIKQVRNYKFLRKYFALLNVGFDNWNPKNLNSKYGVVTKNYNQFRADTTILAGFYETYVRLDGSIRIVPKSISFASMTEEAFQDLYSKTIDVLLKYVYGETMTAEELDKTVEQYLSFA